MVLALAAERTATIELGPAVVVSSLRHPLVSAAPRHRTGGQTCPQLAEPRRTMEETEDLRAARAMRRAMLGDAYVDGMTADPDSVAVEFQDYLTSMAWGVWTRGGALTTRDRSLLVMAMTAALGRMEEFRLHAASAPHTGVSDDEIDELVFQVAAYCGAPAGVAARRSVREVRGTRGTPS